MPWIAESGDKNAIRYFPFRRERPETQREFLDLSKAFDTISSDIPTHGTAKPGERASNSKTPTLTKVSSSCVRTLLSSINALTGETVIQGCADHDQDHSADPSTKSGGEVSTSIKRGERQPDEREQESTCIISYVRSGLNGNFDEIKDIKNQEREQRTVVTDSVSTVTAKIKPKKGSVLGETITIDDDDDDSKSSNDNTMKSNVKMTEKLATGDAEMRSLDKSEAERRPISESQPDTKCTSNVSNFDKFSTRNSSDDLPIVRFDDDDEDILVELSSASSLDLVEYVNAPDERKLKSRRKTFDRISSSTDEETKCRETKTGEAFIFSNSHTISSVLKGNPSTSNASENVKGKLNPALNSANGTDEVASGSAFGFIKQEEDDDDEEESVTRHPTKGNTIDHYQMEMGRRKRKRKRSSNDHKEERKGIITRPSGFIYYMRVVTVD